MFKKLLNTYVNNFPNLQYQKGLCSTYGMSVKYQHGYFQRMFRWATFHDTLYVITCNQKRGSQTS